MSPARLFILGSALLLLAFSVPLWEAVRFSFKSEVYSYLFLIPLVSAYLVWDRRRELLPAGPRLVPGWGLSLLAVGAALGIWYLGILGAGWAVQDRLALAMSSFTFLAAGLACLFLGRATLRVLAFPLGFLILMAPLPTAVEVAFETFLQHGSALAAHGMLEASGMTTFRDGTFFRLPGFSMEVAPECSGIRSTLALFITSLVAGQMFLRSPWRRAFLTLFVFPLALLRNGLRVFTIGQLCVQVGPHMIHSWIHRSGGPFFFALSLIPFSLILYWLLRQERRSQSSLNPSRSTEQNQPLIPADRR